MISQEPKFGCDKLSQNTKLVIYTTVYYYRNTNSCVTNNIIDYSQHRFFSNKHQFMKRKLEQP